MDLVFDSMGSPTNPHLPAPAQATRQLRAWLALVQATQRPSSSFEGVLGLIWNEERA